MPQPKASSGHKLIFTEDESILLTDKNGNVIKLDTQGKNDFANAEKVIIGANPEKMDFRGKGGTLLITKVESEPKGDVSPNQKVTYKVTQYNFSEKVTEADKNRIQ